MKLSSRANASPSVVTDKLSRVRSARFPTSSSPSFLSPGELFPAVNQGTAFQGTISVGAIAASKRRSYVDRLPILTRHRRPRVTHPRIKSTQVKRVSVDDGSSFDAYGGSYFKSDPHVM